MSLEKPKVAIVGIGRWGKNLLKELNEQAEVVWVCHKGSAESLKFLAQNYPNIKTTNLLKDILNDSSIEIVVVATPTNTHFEIAQKVLSANKHLFLEKPGCSTSQKLEILCKEAEKKNLKFSVGYEFAHHPALKKIKELIQMEDMASLHFEWHKWGTFEAPIVPHLLSHDISIIKALGIDSLNPKNYQGQKVISKTDIIEVKFDNDKNISIISHINRVSLNKNKSLTIIGKKASYIWNNDNLFVVDLQNQTFLPIKITDTSAVAEEVKDFLKSIKENKTPLIDGKFALEVWEVINKIMN